jgi:hypothetical protein
MVLFNGVDRSAHIRPTNHIIGATPFLLQTRSGAIPFLKTGMERLRSSLLNQTPHKSTSVSYWDLLTIVLFGSFFFSLL